MSDGAGETIEIESKFAVSAAFTVPEFTGLPGVASLSPPQTYQLVATYFDTRDLSLVKSRVTLRRRTGGTDAGWHLKLPAGTSSRREVHEPLGSDPVAVPARLAGMVAQWAREQPLQPVARLETTRTVRQLTGTSGEVLAEVADDRVTGSVRQRHDDGWRVASAWREVEVELKDGPRDLLAAASEALLRAGAERSASASKVSQVLTEAGLLSPG